MLASGWYTGSVEVAAYSRVTLVTRVASSCRYSPNRTAISCTLPTSDGAPVSSPV